MIIWPIGISTYLDMASSCCMSGSCFLSSVLILRFNLMLILPHASNVTNKDAPSMAVNITNTLSAIHKSNLLNDPLSVPYSSYMYMYMYSALYQMFLLPKA